MNVAFVTSAAPKKGPFYTAEKRPPLGLGSLMSLARKAGHKVYLIDNYLTLTPFIEQGFLQANTIDVVCIYASTICWQHSLTMLHALQNLQSQGKWNGRIAVGGPHVAVMPETVPPFVDYAVQGEGENIILPIIEGTAPPGLNRAKRVLDLDALPFQPWDIFTTLPYDYSCAWLKAQPVFTLNTSRGCPYRCTFCSVNGVWGSRFTCFSAERIADEIEFLIKNYHAKGIYFREDLSSPRFLDR